MVYDSYIATSKHDERHLMISSLPVPSTKRGGARLNAGRKSEINEPLVKLAVTVHALALRQLRVLGDGNLSLGVRRAAEVAYDRYQNERGA